MKYQGNLKHQENPNNYSLININVKKLQTSNIVVVFFTTDKSKQFHVPVWLHL